MDTDHQPRRHGAVFDTIAVEYDRRRPTYPEDLVERAYEAGGLTAGDRVLEIGSGTGQLTRSLVARGLRVTAIEPGVNLIRLARQGLDGPGTVEFVNRRFEDAPPGRFVAAFSASAFHWIDPDVSWHKVAHSLEPGGSLALIQYCGLSDERAADDDEALVSALARVAPAIAPAFPPSRDLDTILGGIDKRRDNVSEVWAWLGPYAVARSYAATLFDEVDVSVVPVFMERTADELNALLRTLSLYHRMSSAQQQALEAATAEIAERFGRPIRTSLLAVLVTARRSSRLGAR